MYKRIIRNNLNLIFVLSLIVIVFLATIFLLYDYKKTELRKTNKLQFEELERLERFISSYNSINLNKLKTAERIFFDMIHKSELISKRKNDSVYVDLIDKGISQKIKISRLFINNKPLYLNNRLADRITYMTNTYISIWQRTEKGYIRISSSKAGLTDEDIPIIFEHSHPIVIDIESGKQHSLRDYSELDTELNSYIPIFIEGNIEGFVQIAVSEFIPATIKKIYKQEKAEFFLLNKKDEKFIGNVSILDDIEDVEVLTDIILSIKAKYTQFNYKQNTLYISFYPELQLYVGFVYAEDVILSNYYIYKKRLIYSFAILSFLLLFGFFVFYKSNIELKQRKLIQFIDVIGINEQSKSRLTEEGVLNKLRIYYSDILNNIKGLSSGIADNELIAGNADNEINVLLKKIQNTLKQNSIEKGKQIDENELKEKLTIGNTEITGLLQHVTNLEDLSFNILKSLTKFLGIQQGGLFIIDESNPKQPVLEMIASYAYNKRRLAEKVISVYEGLVGRAYLERESIYITEVPERYTSIESGFGEEEPKYLLIVPLIFNNKVQAVIELGSINAIKEYQIRFVEEAGENIASTISNLKHSKQTEELLVQTRIQSKEIEEQRQTLEEKINTHRKQNRKLDKEILQLIEIIESIKSVTYMIEYDLKGVVMDVSRKALDLLDIKKRDMISIHHKNFVSDVDYDSKYSKFWEELADNKPQTIKETFIVNNKEYTFVQNYVPIRNVRRKIFRILSIGTIYN